MVGKVLGHYEIREPLGQGGMGEVYRARDTNLDRDVAIKVLPEDLAADPERLARLTREAKLLAQLNHPNIAGVHGLEDDGETRFIAMELVEGETLAERIAKSGRIEVDEALEIARQIAEGLEAAHESGVIHRDLKPANVIVTQDGKAKVLDFGLAKALCSEGGDAGDSLTHSPTATVGATEAGVPLGTAPYMSPEQAKGKVLDKRTDIWAWGCVLFEMLTGKRAFQGDNVTETLAAILKEDPDWNLLPPDTPPLADSLLRRCLRKDLKRRLRDIGDAWIEIEDAPVRGASGDGETRRVGPGIGPTATVFLGLAVLALGALAGWMLAGRGATPVAAPARVDLVFPAGQMVVSSVGSPAIISPDGRRIAYVARTEEGTFLYLRALDNFEPTRVPGTEGASSPFFSPDGAWVAFCADGQLQKAPVGGGEPRAIGACRGLMLGASWELAETIVYSDSTGTGLWQLPAEGGAATSLTAPDVPMSAGHRFPYQLPDGSGILFSTLGPDDRPQMAFLPAGADGWRVVAEGDARFTGMKYLPSGHLLFGQGGSIHVVGFDTSTGRFTEEPRQLIAGVASSSVSQHVYFSASDEGPLVYVPADAAETGSSLSWFDENGEAREIVRVPGGIGHIRLSPDGSKIAVAIRAAGELDPWVYDAATGRGIRLTRGAEAQYPVWAPDGENIAFQMDGDIYEVAANGSGAPQPLLQRERDQWPLSWSDDAARGEQIVFGERGATGTNDILFFSIPDGDVTPFQASDDANEWGADLSPGGDWLAYVSDETGRAEVYVESFPDAGRKQRVSLDGGISPRWSNDGRRLFYGRGSAIFVVPMVEDGRLEVGEEEVAVPSGMSPAVGYDVAGDGRGVVTVNNSQNFQTAATSRLRVLLHWLPALEERRP